MKALGKLLAGAGVVYLLVAFNMDVSVSTSSTYIPGYGSVGGGDVANLDLMARRQNHIIIAALMTLVGALMAIFGQDGEQEHNSSARPKPNSDYAGERDLKADPYRLWLAEKYSIERNEVFDRFVVEGQTFSSLDEALEHAHETEQSVEAARIAAFEAEQAREAEQEEAYRLAKEEAEQQWEAFQPKLLAGSVISIVLLIGGYFVFAESEDERASRLAAEEKTRVEKIEQTQAKFGIAIPSDASELRITERANDYSFLCNEAVDGTLLQYSTSTPKDSINEALSEIFGEGESEYYGLDDPGSWIWKKDGRRYDLSIFENSDTMNSTSEKYDVNLCITDA